MSTAQHRERGAATLVIVMVLFLVMAMMAAYAGRGMVYEQRIAGNHALGALAQNTADAGAEWALAMLNRGRIDANCKASNIATNTSFRERYLNIDSERKIDVKAQPSGNTISCTRLETGWQCNCPVNGSNDVPTQSSERINPVFWLEFKAVNPGDIVPGVVNLTSVGCSGDIPNCKSIANSFSQGIAQAKLHLQAGLVSALKVPPASPLMAQNKINLSAAGATDGAVIQNTDPSSGGIVLQTGGVLDGQQNRLVAPPGTPVEAMVISEDASLQRGSADGFFRLFFGMNMSTYRDQPAAWRVKCTANEDCGAALSAAVAQGAHILYVDGAAEIRQSTVLGSVLQPVVVVVNGSLRIYESFEVAGAVFTAGTVTWNQTGSQRALLQGALITASAAVFTGQVHVIYNRQALNTLSQQRGSFVRVPGSWNSHE